MACRISVIEDQGFVILEYNGDIKRNEALKDFLKAYETGREKGIKKFLINLNDSKNADTAVNTYQFAYEDLGNPAFDKTITVALLVSPDNRTHDFSETVLINSGLNARLFRDYKKAVKYLKKAE